MAEQNALDGIAEELFGWMDQEVGYYVNALKGGPNGRAPFSADTSPKERHDYFTRKLFTQNPDGSIDYSKPNAQGRAEVMQGYGPGWYGKIYDEVRPKRGRRPIPIIEETPDPDEPEPPEPEY